MRAPDTNPDATELALRALVWTLAEPDRALRLLETTGLMPADLRARGRTGGAGRRARLSGGA